MNLTRTEWIEPEAFVKLIAFMKYENALAVRCMLETGLRIGDVLKMRPEDVKNKKIYYTAEKTGKRGVAKISAGLEKELKQNASECWVFPGRKPGKHRTRQAVWDDLKKACKRNGITANVAPHSARKIRAVEEYHKNGLDATRKLLQHDNTLVTLGYAFADKKNEYAPTGAQCVLDLDTLAEKIARRVCALLSEKGF